MDNGAASRWCWGTCFASTACRIGSICPIGKWKMLYTRLRACAVLRDSAELPDTLPDETTILNFRHLLEKHELTVVFLEAINARLKARGLLVSKGTMVDATLIHAPSSTKNGERARDPEMHQAKKGKQWYFGMKVHVGAVTSPQLPVPHLRGIGRTGPPAASRRSSWCL